MLTSTNTIEKRSTYSGCIADILAVSYGLFDDKRKYYSQEYILLVSGLMSSFNGVCSSNVAFLKIYCSTVLDFHTFVGLTRHTLKIGLLPHICMPLQMSQVAVYIYVCTDSF